MLPRLPSSSLESKIVQSIADLHVGLPVISKFNGLLRRQLPLCRRRRQRFRVAGSGSQVRYRDLVAQTLKPS